MTTQAAPRSTRRRARTLDVLIALNPAATRTGTAGGAEALARAIEERRLRARVVETQAGAEGRRALGLAVTRALAFGCRRVVAVGGDGTVAMIAAFLIARSGRRRPVRLGIVPTGTANVLARELGIPLAFEEAVALALDGRHTIRLDAIRAPDRPVLTQVGVGLDAQMIRHTSRKDRVAQGRLAYAAAFVRRALTHRPTDFELEIDGRPIRARAWQVVVANIGVLGAPPFTWGPGIDPSDGTVDVCLYAARSLRGHLTLIQRLLTGRHHPDSHTRYFRAEREVTIRSRRPALVQGDGEILGHTPVTLKMMPRVLRVCVPKPVAARPAPPDPPPRRGAPVEPSPPAERAAADGAEPAPPAELRQDVEQMVARHSRTWPLQGWLRHPFTYLAALDAALYMRINVMVLGPVADWTLLVLSRVMHYGEGWAVVALVMLAVDFRTAIVATAEALPVLWATMLTVNFPLKRVFRRRRPFVAFVRARVLGPQPRDHSFPSGHTAAAFAGALLFGGHAPAWAPFFYAIATVIGFSRIYLGVHYPSDVVIGAAIGSLLAGGYLALLRILVGIWF